MPINFTQIIKDSFHFMQNEKRNILLLSMLYFFVDIIMVWLQFVMLPNEIVMSLSNNQIASTMSEEQGIDLVTFFFLKQFIYIFIIVATALSVWIGHPLIKLNFDKERLNGDYRYSLIRVRDNAESIAFYGGEIKERSNLQAKFHAIIHNRWVIVRRMLGLDGFNTGVTQIAMILPLMLQAPRFFAGQVKLGDMHQTVQAFNRLMRALSFFRLFYEEFTLYQARLNRLYGFFTKLDELDGTDIHQPVECSHRVSLRHFGIKDGNGKVLLKDLNVDLQNGDALLIQGPSGAGKTSLLKAIAGIYPFDTEGRVERPCSNSLFLPQRPYMPQGMLREAICYPNIEPKRGELELAMEQCRLSKYIPSLNESND